MTTSSSPAADVQVVAIEQSVAGPLCSRILADLGADVIKVEPPRGDFARHWDTHANGEASHFAWLNRRKRSIALDLGEPRDLGVLHKLLAAADVLVFNMSLRAAQRLDLTGERLEAAYPRLVACQITGYGNRGEMCDRKAYDMLVQAETGLMSLTGDESGPVRIGVSVADVGTGIYAAALVLAALLEREHTGRGKFIDISMFETMLEFAGPNLIAFANAGVRYPRSRMRHHSISPYGIFETADGQIALAVEHDDEWRRLCRLVLNRPDLDIERYSTNERRHAHRDELETAVESELRRRSRSEWLELLDRAGLAFASVNEIDQVWEHPVVRDLGLKRQVALPNGQLAWVPTSPAERAFERTDGEPPVPALDADRDALLTTKGANQARSASGL